MNAGWSNVTGFILEWQYDGNLQIPWQVEDGDEFTPPLQYG